MNVHDKMRFELEVEQYKGGHPVDKDRLLEDALLYIESQDKEIDFITEELEEYRYKNDKLEEGIDTLNNFIGEDWE